MELAEALDIVVDRTNHHRFRELTDPAHPDYNPAYIPVVIKLAVEGPTPDPSSLRIALEGWWRDAIQMFRTEFFGEAPPAGCGGCGGQPTISPP